MQRKIVVLLVGLFFGFLGNTFAQEVQKEVRGADFVVNVWDMETLSGDHQKLVTRGKDCDTYHRCRSSYVIGGTLRRCADAGLCKRSEKPLLLKLKFSLKPELDGEYEVIGKKNFLVPYGTKVTAELVSPKVEVPVGVYTLEPKEWDLDTDIKPGDVARLHSHWVISPPQTTQ